MQTHTLPTYQEQKVLVVTSLANLRQQLPPSYTGAVPATQNYPIALALGGASPFSGGAAFYAWDSESALADNNSTVIKPDNAQVGGQPGRWRMLGGAL
jgi:hypothetical protein